jgi:predicted nucleic acid-binding protein
MSYLLDTNVISEARKPAGDPSVRAWMASTRSADLFLSVLVIGEIRQGIERLRRRDPVQARTYETWLTTLRQGYADRILPVSTDVAEMWGRLNVERSLAVVDGLLAATAIVAGMTLVTRNTADVVGTGVQLLNPWIPPTNRD